MHHSFGPLKREFWTQTDEENACKMLKTK